MKKLRGAESEFIEVLPVLLLPLLVLSSVFLLLFLPLWCPEISTDTSSQSKIMTGKIEQHSYPLFTLSTPWVSPKLSRKTAYKVLIPSIKTPI